MSVVALPSAAEPQAAPAPAPDPAPATAAEPAPDGPSPASGSPSESASEPAATSAAAAKPAVKPAYPPPSSTPTQTAPMGIRFDFNQGARIVLPARPETDPQWKVRLRDLDTGNVLFESENRGAFVASSKRFYVRFRLEVYEGETAVFEHDYSAKDREVLIQFPVGTLGDILAWFPYAEKFRVAHGCRLTCALSGLIIPLIKDAYPQIAFVTHEEMVEQKLTERVYATYSMGLFFDDKDNIWQPTDFRHVGLHRTAGYILGVDPAETPPRIVLVDDSRPIAEPYVCIAVQSSSGCKMWNNPTGWHEVVAHIKARGYRVICIDQKPVHGSGLLYTHIPHGAEDETGDRPLAERARWLKHAATFVGLSSGLAWLAWAAGTPVVLISGFTHPTNEFTTPYRVINWHACNSCWNDPKERFQHTDFMWCPRHQNTPRHFECTKLITGAHVKAQIDRALGAPA
ncbi:MAG TPA: autotransporter strand-loop-strand O-heptosyltransferase [Caulobacteraceae bacterium]|nr:autotransporter strand-loop-strand O-heptosyltransferase [Caulobacteraceae bacterium]